MDTTETIILTTIVNIIITGLVGGIVIYTVQKKIDATIQRSLFEHQIKFSRSYEKTVETLENLCKKLAICNQSFRQLALGAITFHRHGIKELDVDASYYEKNKLQLEEFYNYFEEHRYALPDDFLYEVITIYFKLNQLQLALPIALPFYNFDDRWELIRLFLTGTPLDTKVNWEQPDFQSLLKKMVTEFGEQVVILEELYQSVAHTEQ